MQAVWLHSKPCLHLSDYTGAILDSVPENCADLCSKPVQHLYAVAYLDLLQYLHVYQCSVTLQQSPLNNTSKRLFLPSIHHIMAVPLLVTTIVLPNLVDGIRKNVHHTAGSLFRRTNHINALSKRSSRIAILVKPTKKFLPRTNVVSTKANRRHTNAKSISKRVNNSASMCKNHIVWNMEKNVRKFLRKFRLPKFPIMVKLLLAAATTIRGCTT
ncbi:hypothetical protein Gasu2_40930 [Galdieria sulphuraria]|nr:hypothetical protein Gasu2_40930 [Galdieria sulphuraria]